MSRPVTGSDLQRFCAHHGWTGKRLAETLGISVGHINNTKRQTDREISAEYDVVLSALHAGLEPIYVPQGATPFMAYYNAGFIALSHGKINLWTETSLGKCEAAKRGGAKRAEQQPGLFARLGFGAKAA